MKIDQDLVDRTQALLGDFKYLLDHDPEVSGELRVKLAKAELHLFKIASLMQGQVDRQKRDVINTVKSTFELILNRKIG
jgi:hypothetical protein